MLSRGKRRVYPGHLQFCRKCPIWDTRTFRCAEKLLNKLHRLKTKDSFLRCFTKELRHKLLRSCPFQVALQEIRLCTGLCRNELIYKSFETFLVLLQGGDQVESSFENVSHTFHTPTWQRALSNVWASTKKVQREAWLLKHSQLPLDIWQAKDSKQEYSWAYLPVLIFT